MNEFYRDIRKIKELYNSGENVIEFLNKNQSSNLNALGSILISYDLQSGSYIDYYNNNKTQKEGYTKAIANHLNNLGTFNNLLEAGVGEATTLATLIKYLDHKPDRIFGFDLSWSRIKYAREFCENVGQSEIELATGDLFLPPFEENSIDVVYTSHSIEPNGGKERDALIALHKIANRYLVLFEPIYEFASPNAQARMRQHGYIKGLYKEALELGFNVVKYELLEGIEKSENPTGVIIIEKNELGLNSSKSGFACPYSQTPLTLENGYLTSENKFLSYPIIDGILCLNPDNAILTTHHS